MSQPIFSVDSIFKACVSDFMTACDNSKESYVALISLDFSKRKINRSKSVFMFVIEGDDLDSAIKNFRDTDESDGTNDDDFIIGEVMTVHLQCEL